jgi:lysophospholipase L1-like esterase
MLRSLLGSSFIGLVLVACGGSSADTAGATGSSSGSGGHAATTTSSTTGAGATTSTSSGAGGGTGGGGDAVGVKFKTYVTLGDSISAEAGSPTTGFGQPPFYWELLQQNDDTTYPSWKGKDLTTLNGGVAPTFVSGAIGGSVAGQEPGLTGAPPTLDMQVAGLPATLEGPVLVTITIGGNDMVAAAENILLSGGSGLSDLMPPSAFQADLDTALGALTKAGRFGAGVEVYVFQADVYDPTDGAGDFSAQGCPFPLSVFPTTPTTMAFDNWNTVVHSTVPKYPQAFWAPMHDTFEGHGLSTTGTSSWFNWSGTDCLHPNAKGHNAIREMFWNQITGGG